MPAISTRRSQPPRKRKRWPKPRYSRPTARKRPGRPKSFASVVPKARREARRNRMTIRRRDFLKATGLITLAGGLPRIARGADAPSVYDLERFGNARILHM